MHMYMYMHMHILIVTCMNVSLHLDACGSVECLSGYECQVYQPTGETFCSPNCEDLNPCESDEICVIQPLYCIRAPCPGFISCQGNEQYICVSVRQCMCVIGVYGVCVCVCVCVC